MSILDLETRATYRSKEEAATARGITVQRVERLMAIGRLLPMVPIVLESVLLEAPKKSR